MAVTALPSSHEDTPLLRQGSCWSHHSLSDVTLSFSCLQATFWQLSEKGRFFLETCGKAPVQEPLVLPTEQERVNKEATKAESSFCPSYNTWHVVAVLLVRGLHRMRRLLRGGGDSPCAQGTAFLVSSSSEPQERGPQPHQPPPSPTSQHKLEKNAMSPQNSVSKEHCSVGK